MWGMSVAKLLVGISPCQFHYKMLRVGVSLKLFFYGTPTFLQCRFNILQSTQI